jgi:hypothetical protein
MCSIIINIIILKKSFGLNDSSDGFEDESLIISIISLLQGIFSIISITILGVHSLYFKVLSRMLWFIFYSLIMICYCLAIMITTYIFEISKENNDSEEIKDFLKIKRIMIFLCIVKCIFYLASSVITWIERRKIMKEINDSPFNIVVDEEFTEQMYKNIIDHSLNPLNKDAKEEFNRYTLYSREKGKHKSLKSLPFSINSSENGSKIESEAEKKSK